MTEQSNKELLDALGVDVAVKKKRKYTAKEERIIAGFEEIQAFFDDHKRHPLQGEDRDIFERLYAVRLEQIRKQTECRDLVKELDHQGLLEGISEDAIVVVDDASDEELLAELGVSTPREGDVAFLKHVKPRAEVRAAEDVANRTQCEDFDAFKPIFESVQVELKSGLRNAIPYKDFAKVEQGDLFILSGQIVYVAEVLKEFVNKNHQKDGRLWVIYDNGTESELLVRSLQRALNKDDAGRRITSASLGPLFEGISDKNDIESGTIYVLRSQSEHPVIAKNSDVIHKIGVTGASLKPDFLMPSLIRLF